MDRETLMLKPCHMVICEHYVNETIHQGPGKHCIRTFMHKGTGFSQLFEPPSEKGYITDNEIVCFLGHLTPEERNEVFSWALRVTARMAS